MSMRPAHSAPHAALFSLCSPAKPVFAALPACACADDVAFVGSGELASPTYLVNVYVLPGVTWKVSCSPTDWGSDGFNTVVVGLTFDVICSRVAMLASIPVPSACTVTQAVCAVVSAP